MRNEAIPPVRRALVVFSGHADLAWLKVLKRGYRHCFAVVDSGQGAWIVYNPMSHCTEISLIAGLNGPAIVGHYRALGFCVVETRVVHPPRRSAPWRPYTCVEAVKRLLGLRASGVFTPWNLYNFLITENKFNNHLTKGIYS